VVLIGKRIYFEVKTGKAQTERIPFEDVLEQVETVAQTGNIRIPAQSTTAN